MTHTERVEEVEGQEAHPKVALSTILAVFVSVFNGSRYDVISLTVDSS